MSFWDNVFETRPAARPAPVPQQQAPLNPTVSANPWWRPEIPQSPIPQQYEQQPQIQQGLPSKAVLAGKAEYCPDCGSNSYFRPSPNAALQCGACGYNSRGLVSSTHGMNSIGGDTDSGPVTAARQPTGGTTLKSIMASPQKASALGT